MRKGPAVAVTVALALGIAVGGAAMGGVTIESLTHWGEPRNVLVVGEREVPLPAPEDAPSRKLPPVDVAGTSGYSFTTKDAGQPVLHDPCRVITWRLSTHELPEGAEQLVRDAVASIETHTGLKWEEGDTSPYPANPDHSVLTQVDGRWEYAPVEIGFTRAGGKGLGGDTVGVGGTFVTPGAWGDQQYLRSGVVLIDKDAINAKEGTEEFNQALTTVLLHELGHVVGLDHVADADQVMFAAFLPHATWGEGDLAGLAAAGRGTCEGAS